MHRFHTSHAAARLLLALGLILGLTTPVSAGGASIDVAVAVSSPQTVTVGHYVAYPVRVQNSGPNTLNTVSVTGTSPDGFTYIGSTPAFCSQTAVYCYLGQMASGTVAPIVTFYFHVDGSAPRDVTFHATVSTAEGSNDNSDGTANNQDTWPSNEITTNVVPFTQDYISGHGITDLNGYSEPGLSTGLGVTGTNPHGTAVGVPSNAEITLEDLPPSAAPCPAGYSTCWGWASRLDVGTDDNNVAQEFPTGIVVTMVWDDSQLPNGMSPKKLRVLHITDAGSVELVNSSCTYDSVSGLPNNMPCFLAPPSKVADKDIQAVMLWAHNGIGRGW